MWGEQGVLWRGEGAWAVERSKNRSTAPGVKGRCTMSLCQLQLKSNGKVWQSLTAVAQNLLCCECPPSPASCRPCPSAHPAA